jgi:hypothetical protein
VPSIPINVITIDDEKIMHSNPAIVNTINNILIYRGDGSRFQISYPMNFPSGRSVKAAYRRRDMVMPASKTQALSNKSTLSVQDSSRER